MKFGNLTVLERAEDKICPSEKLVQWKCRCVCGNEKLYTLSNLKRTKSCGCLAHENTRLEDLTGMQFGDLEVIERAESKTIPCGQNQTVWKCRCKCGSIVFVRAAHLKDGLTKSCGCVKSQGEKEICRILTENNIKFKREYTFKDLLSSKNKRLRFDFLIYTDNTKYILLEFQGIQHFASPNCTWFGEQQRNETDNLKLQYCLKNNIELYYINYYDDIEHELLKILHISQDDTVPSSKEKV